MSSPTPFFTRRWLLVPLCATLFVGALDWGRIQQVERVRDLERTTTTRGDAEGRHWLVAPEHHNRTYQWLLETEQMLAEGTWRVRQTARENAPAGREVHAASPYRWWLGLIAWTDHTASGRPVAESVERAALWAGPLLHLLAIIAGTLLVQRRFGDKAAAMLAAGLAGLFPLAGEFLPGVADDRGLALLCAGTCALGLVAGRPGHSRWFLLSGVAGGLGLWVNAAMQLPMLAALGAGALLRAIAGRWTGVQPSAEPPAPWNLWALAGAGTALAGFFVEYFPAHLGLRLQVNHPLHGFAWIGLGALLTLTEEWSRGQAAWNRRTLLTAGVAVAGLGAGPLALALTDSAGYLFTSPAAGRLTSLPDGPVAASLALWLNRGGAGLAAVALLLPFTLLVPVGFAYFASGTERTVRQAAVLAAGAMLFCAILACMQLQWWAVAQVLLLTGFVATGSLLSVRTIWFAAVVLLPGIIHLADTAWTRPEAPLTALEAEGLVERDIAHWLAHRTEPGAVVLAPPERTPGLVYHGGLRGIGSANWENVDGMAFTFRVIGATTADEALALLNQRGVTHLVLPSWDRDLDEFISWSMPDPENAFLTAVRRWALPPWLEPVAYRLPGIAGFEDRSVVILKVTENTDRALALSRLAEYALETQNLEMAAAVNETLKNHPSHLGALIGRAQVEKARGETAAFDQVTATLRQNLTNRLDRLLPWDRRVSLAVVLAQSNHPELAKPQVQRCLAELNGTRIRSLSEGALYRLLVLSKAYDLPVTQPGLRDQMLALLPPEARARL